MLSLRELTNEKSNQHSGGGVQGVLGCNGEILVTASERSKKRK